MNAEPVNVKVVGDSWSSQQASLHAAPTSVDNHKKPGVEAIGGKANQAIKHA